MNFMVGRCRVRISFFCPAVLALLLFSTSGDVAAAAFLAAAAHETAHLAVMGALGCLPEQISFTAFGIDIVRPPRGRHGYAGDAAVSLAGPAGNLLFAALLTPFRGAGCEKLILANLLLFCFNILPVEPLDGGQALYSLLCIRLEPDRAAKIVAVLSFFTLLPLSAVGFFVLLRSKGSYSLLLVCVYLMALLVLKRGRFFG